MLKQSPDLVKMSANVRVHAVFVMCVTLIVDIKYIVLWHITCSSRHNAWTATVLFTLCVHTLYALQGVTNAVKVQGSVVMTSEEEGEFSDMDVSFESSQSLYIPTPQKNLWAHRVSLKVPLQDKVAFVELKQLDYFVQQMNACWRCATPGCSGDLVPSSVKTSGLGGAVSITFSAMVAFGITFSLKAL